MRFIHPEILYALFALIIPIVVHLFQLRRFKTEDFTNVALLQKLVISSRKSSQLKKWLTLLTRLLLLSCVILAFAQPYFPNEVEREDEKELSIFLDNSYSMSLKGEKGELFLRAKEDLLEYLPENEKFHLSTHSDNYRDLTKKELKSIIFDLGYTSNSLDFNSLQTKSISSFQTNVSTKKNVVVLSDFQNSQIQNKVDSLQNVDFHYIKYNPVNTFNFSIDTLFVKNSNNGKQLVFNVKSSNPTNSSLPISIFDDNKLLGKLTLKFENEKEKTYEFNIADGEIKNGKIVIEDSGLHYDNTFYFSISNPEPVNILIISKSYSEYFDRIYKSDKFNYKQVLVKNLEYTDISSNAVILLNELDEIPDALSVSIENAYKADKVIGIIPSENSNIMGYNRIFKTLDLNRYNSKIDQEIKLTNINFSHPLFENVFTDKVENFDYPTFDSYFESTSNNKALSFSNGFSFLELNGKSFRFNAPIENNSNFKQSPLIVVSFYNLALQAQTSRNLFFTTGQNQTISIKTTLKNDEVLKIEKNNDVYIPRQQPSGENVNLTLIDFPSLAGHYVVKNSENDTLQHLAYNYDRTESLLEYQNMDNKTYAKVYNNFNDFSEYFNSNYKINSKWQWFIAFALMFMIIELLLLRFIK